jgi:hypothetical protein
MATIETIFRGCIHYEVWDINQEPQSEKVENKSFNICRKLGVECESFAGNGACSPYVKLEGETYEAVARAASQIENYIKRFKTWELL